jgi:WD40 repeat protein
VADRDRAGQWLRSPNIDRGGEPEGDSLAVHRFDAAAIGAAFDRTSLQFAVVLGNGQVVRMMWGAAGGPMRIAAWNQVHADATLHWLAVPAGVITGSDDGRVVLTRFADPIVELYRAPGHWIDALDFHVGAGLLAVATGRSVRVIEPGRLEVVRFDGHPSTVAALAFTPSGDAVAAAHYGGVTMHVFRKGVGQFARKGSMVAVTVSPDARFVVAGAQDREVVVWPTEGGEPMEMSGYGGKPLSLSWSGDGKHLATSGADGVIVWPFGGRRGPFGQRPLELAPERKALVTAVAFHPSQRRIAFGYRDGFAALIGFSGEPEVLAEADGEAVTALVWSADGFKLAVCGDSGRVVVRTWAKPKPGLFKRLWG